MREPVVEPTGEVMEKTCWVCFGEGGWYDPWDTEPRGPWEECFYCHGTGRLSMWVWMKDWIVERWYK